MSQSTRNWSILPAKQTIVLATNNPGKLRELRALLAHLPIEFIAAQDIAKKRIDVIEDGATFAENALKKAVSIAKMLAMPALADDSGLEVDALHGHPGVRSARYAGEGATDGENNQKLLTEMAEINSLDLRSARFRCTLVFVDPATLDQPIEVSGTCEGAIAPRPKGTGGFGYDPIFLVDEFGRQRTMAECTDEEKRFISHRARAIRNLEPKLRAWLDSSIVKI